LCEYCETRPIELQNLQKNFSSLTDPTSLEPSSSLACLSFTAGRSSIALIFEQTYLARSHFGKNSPLLLKSIRQKIRTHERVDDVTSTVPWFRELRVIDAARQRWLSFRNWGWRVLKRRWFALQNPICEAITHEHHFAGVFHALAQYSASATCT
jgi:hypothetical protein